MMQAQLAKDSAATDKKGAKATSKDKKVRVTYDMIGWALMGPPSHVGPGTAVQSLKRNCGCRALLYQVVKIKEKKEDVLGTPKAQALQPLR
jgi:hypothetical protein